MSGPTFSRVPTRAIYDENLEHSELRVLAALGTYADASGSCWPSLRTLAKRLGYKDRRAVQRRIRKLQALGYLNVSSRSGENGSQVASQYHIPDLLNPGRGRQQQPPGDGRGDHREGGYDGHKGGGRGDHPNRPKNKPDEHTESAFEEFWKIYPSRGDNNSNPKKPARAKFSAAVKKGTDPESIIRGAKNYAEAEHNKGTAPRYIAAAKTWLEDERWEDYQAVPSIGVREADPQPRSLNAI